MIAIGSLYTKTVQLQAFDNDTFFGDCSNNTEIQLTVNRSKAAESVILSEAKNLIHSVSPEILRFAQDDKERCAAPQDDAYGSLLAFFSVKAICNPATLSFFVPNCR